MSRKKEVRKTLESIVSTAMKGVCHVNDFLLSDKIEEIGKTILGVGVTAGIVVVFAAGIYGRCNPVYLDRGNGCKVSLQPMFEQITPDIYVDYNVIFEECGQKKTNYRVSVPESRCEAVRVYENDELIIDETIEKGDKYNKQCMELLDWVNREWKESYLKKK